MWGAGRVRLHGWVVKGWGWLMTMRRVRGVAIKASVWSFRTVRGDGGSWHAGRGSVGLGGHAKGSGCSKTQVDGMVARLGCLKMTAGACLG